MKHLLLAALGLLRPLAAVLAQAPVLTGLTPLANATAAPRTAPLTATFSQALTPTSASALQVFSAQRGGLRTRLTPATVSGNTLAFAPTAYPFLPGETVQYTITTAATGSGGALARPWVGQFTAAVGSVNTGNYTNTPAPMPLVRVNYAPSSVALGDVDNDGDVDLLIATYGTINVRLNDGLGTFTGTQAVPVSGSGYKVVLADMDSDGDLDLLTAAFSNVVSMRLNDGSGTFSSGPDVTLPGNVSSLALGDVDGDGSLDLLAANANTTSVSVRLNTGSGRFAGGSEVAVAKAWHVALGDVDNDGDLDLLATSNDDSGTVNVCLNSGIGTFSSSQTIVTGARSQQAVLGDVDKDGDLDLLVANYSNTPVTLYRNDGTGTFGASQSVYVYSNNTRAASGSIALGDVEGDGDLDVFLAIETVRSPSPFGGTTSAPSFTTIKLVNDGTGKFTVAETIVVGDSPHNVVVGDVNGDGGLDFVTSDYGSGTASIRLNGRLVALAGRTGQVAELVVFPNPAAHRTLTLMGAPPRVAVQVVDMLGRVVHTNLTLTDAIGTLHLTLPAELPAGSYLVRSNGQVRRLTLE
jgi:predicted nucleotidyltransferase